MSKIARAVQKIFGSSAGTNQIAKFGSLAAAAPAYSTDPATIQSLTQYLTGWFGAVIGGNSPAIEDMNAIHYLFAYQLAYIFQAGVSEWDSSTTYFKGSQVNSNGNIYVSLIDTNLNQALTDATKWKLMSSPAAPFDVIVGNQTTYPYATHATLAAAVADANLGTNLRVLLLDSQTISTTISLSKAGWYIKSLPGVTYTDGGAAGTCISIAADGVDISNLRFASFGTACVTCTAGGTYARIWNCRFATSNTASVINGSAPAGKYPTTFGNIDET